MLETVIMIEVSGNNVAAGVDVPATEIKRGFYAIHVSNLFPQAVSKVDRESARQFIARRNPV